MKKKESRSQSPNADKPAPEATPDRSNESAPIRSMTGFARVTGTAPDNVVFVLTLKSVNHRFLDLQFHLPNGMDALEMRWRKTLKERLVRGHVDVRLSLASTASHESIQYNPAVIRAYLTAFRAEASGHDLPGKPDLNVAFQLPGAWLVENAPPSGDLSEIDEAADASLMTAIESLNAMREQEGATLAEELRQTLTRLQQQVDGLSELRADMQQAYSERLEQKMREILGDAAPPQDRIVVEAALMAERSDIEEEIARMRAHIGHFHDLLRQGGELGKKLDFLLQEMGREANTTLSKTGGIANRSLRITELGLAVKSEIEKAREQVQNLE